MPLSPRALVAFWRDLARGADLGVVGDTVGGAYYTCAAGLEASIDQPEASAPDDRFYSLRAKSLNDHHEQIQKDVIAAVRPGGAFSQPDVVGLARSAFEEGFSSSWYETAGEAWDESDTLRHLQEISYTPPPECDL